MGTKPLDRINVESRDRVYLRIAPFDSTVRAELGRAGLDPAKVQDNFSSELHYQLFLKKQEESSDSAGATVRVAVSVQHLQPGSGNTGGFAAGTLEAEREGKIERAVWESRESAKDNVPVEFLPLQVPRTLAGEILSRMKAKPQHKIGEFDYATPMMLFP
jgi:hypothetical protein